MSKADDAVFALDLILREIKKNTDDYRKKIPGILAGRGKAADWSDDYRAGVVYALTLSVSLEETLIGAITDYMAGDGVEKIREKFSKRPSLMLVADNTKEE